MPSFHGAIKVCEDMKWYARGLSIDTIRVMRGPVGATCDPQGVVLSTFPLALGYPSRQVRQTPGLPALAPQYDKRRCIALI